MHYFPKMVTSSNAAITPVEVSKQQMLPLRFPDVITMSAGDILQDGDVIAQIETDKVTIDVRYTEAKPGKLKEILVGADDTVTVGQAVCIVEQVQKCRLRRA